MKKQDITLKVIGIIFLVLGIAAIINIIIHVKEGLAPILWLSYICLIVLGIGVLKKDSSLIASQICILGIPYIFWNIDFFYYLFNERSIFGIVDYFFEPGEMIGKIISSQHIFNLPLGILAIYLIGLKRTDFWKISMFQIFIVFVISRIGATYEDNVNCAYHNCANFSFGLPYILEWFLAYIIMISITSFILIKILKKK